LQVRGLITDEDGRGACHHHNAYTLSLAGVRARKRSKITKRGRDPVVVSNKATRVKPARIFIEDVDYEKALGEDER